MEKRVQLVVEAFKARYGARSFIEKAATKKLIRLLLQGDKVEKMIAACQAGQAPLRVAVYEIEAFAEKNGVLENGTLSDEWKKDVGRLVGAIVYLAGYVADDDAPEEKEDLQKTPKYFHYAAKFHKMI